MSGFEWFLLIVIVIGVPLIVAVVVTIWTIDQARKRKRQNRPDAQIGVKRRAVREPVAQADPVATGEPAADVSRETPVADAAPDR